MIEVIGRYMVFVLVDRVEWVCLMLLDRNNNDASPSAVFCAAAGKSRDRNPPGAMLILIMLTHSGDWW